MKKTDQVYDSIDKARNEILKMLNNMESSGGEIAARKMKSLRQLDAFLEKTAKKKQPEEIIQKIEEALHSIRKQQKTDYGNLQKKYDKDMFDAINLLNFEIKIYKYILKGR